MIDDSYILVLTTCNSEERARYIADGLVEQQLAACVNILPGVESVYRWKGQIEHDREILLLIKSRQSLYTALEKAIQTLHDYELPEIVAVSIDTGLPAYLNWIKTVTGLKQ